MPTARVNREEFENIEITTNTKIKSEIYKKTQKGRYKKTKNEMHKKSKNEIYKQDQERDV